MAGAAALQRMKLERRLAYLGTLGNNAPFIGLFGTVIGVIGAFDELGGGQDAGARRAAAGAAAVMASIAEALVATAVGLAVAIPAVAAYNYFQRLIKLDARQHRGAHARPARAPQDRARTCAEPRPPPQPSRAARPRGRRVKDDEAGKPRTRRRGGGADGRREPRTTTTA